MKKNNEKNKHTILITDDSEINRSLLADMLGDEFNILEAEDGTQAVSLLQNEGAKIDLVLLDIVMPKMDGFEVLALMNRNDWIKDIPVIVISSETSPSCMERAYELGVTDFINRPFDTWIVRRRVMNTLMLASKQKTLVGMVTDQIFKREKMSNMMITILSHIVEFRNGESGLHVIHIRTITELLLRELVIKTDKYHLSQNDISMISIASALHDIGKIGIPDEILNKPGRLTSEEYEVMKRHSEYGAAMLDDLAFLQDEKLIQYARQICRWHHERFDGRGYPDGLKGENIPISAQVVSLADVYDALTSPRVYKKAYTHEEAIKMILNGECGTFNPSLLDCLVEIQNKLKEELKVNSLSRNTYVQMQHVSEEMLQDEELSASSRTLTLLENERIKTRFFAELSQEIQFEYGINSRMLTIYDFGKRKLGLDELIVNPLEDDRLKKLFGPDQLNHFVKLVRNTTPKCYAFNMECSILLGGEDRWVRISGRTLFSGESQEKTGIIGKIIDINREHKVLTELQHKATHDLLTLLYNAGTAKDKIMDLLSAKSDKEYVLLMIDLDYLKTINDTYGHNFGNQVLQHISDKLKAIVRKNDIIARMGGDEFLVFFEEHKTQDATIKRIFNSLTEPFNNLDISVSIGVALTRDCGKDYDKVFNCADSALYKAKNGGKHCIRYYDSTLTTSNAALTQKDEMEQESGYKISFETKEEFYNLLTQLRGLYDRIHVTDVSNSIKYFVDLDGSLKECSERDRFVKSGRVGAYDRALLTHGKGNELAYRGNNLYYVTAAYISCGSSGYIVETMLPMEEQTKNGLYDKTEIIGKIDNLGKKKYKDSETNTFNRQFYTEQLAETTNFYSIILLQTVEVKTMSKIASLIYEKVRSTDMLVRTKDNEFALIMKNISDNHFKEVIKNLYDSIVIEAKINIGACRSLGKVEDLLSLASKNLEYAKKENCGYYLNSK